MRRRATERKPGKKHINRQAKNPRTTVTGPRGNRFGSNGFPPSIRTKLTYEDLILLNPGVSIQQYTFRGNSDFDPDYTSTGHKYRYTDIYDKVYSKYRIYGSRITLDVVNNAADSAVIFTILPYSEIITSSTWQQVAELPVAKVSKAVPTSQQYPIRLSHAMSTSSVIGLKNGEINDDDYAAITGSNPVQIWYWNLAFFTMDLRSNLNVSIRVRLECDICYFDREDVGLSKLKDPELNHVKIPRDKLESPMPEDMEEETQQLVTKEELMRILAKRKAPEDSRTL